MLFDFVLNPKIWLSLARRDAEPLVEALTSAIALARGAQWATFLRNHDELDLSRLTDEQRGDVSTAFAPDPGLRVYRRGIRRRLGSMLGGDRRHVELAYALQFALPGTPVVRYGEEIGMGENLRLEDREAIRTPMQWDDGPNAGFSTAESGSLVRPVTEDGELHNLADEDVVVYIGELDGIDEPYALTQRWYGRLQPLDDHTVVAAPATTTL